MRLICFFIAASLAGCTSTGKKDTATSAGDTTMKNNPPVSVQKIEPVRGTTADIPSGIKVRGSVYEVWKWNDSLGENLLITTIVAPYNDKEKNENGEEGQTAELHAFHYARKNDDYQLVWMMNDKEKACPFDITCEFIKDAISVTDLDANNIAETTILYRITCRSDVSPATMKLIMHQGSGKYALRGLTWYGMGEIPFEITAANANLEKLSGYKGTDDDIFKTFGRYESEKEFDGAPPAFISYARNQWVRFVKESTE